MSRRPHASDRPVEPRQRDTRERSSAALLAVLLPLVACDEGDVIERAPAELSVAPTALEFGEVPVGAVRRLNIELRNTSAQAVEVETSTLSNPFFANVAVTLTGGAKADFSVAFRPTAEVRSDARIRFRIKGEGAEQWVSLSGVGIAPRVEVSPLELTFLDVPVQTSRSEELLLYSKVGEPVRIKVSTADFPRPEHVSVDVLRNVTETATFELPAHGARGLEVHYHPILETQDQGLVLIEAGCDGCVYEIPVSGNGVASQVELVPATQDLGEVLLGETRAGQVQVRNRGATPFVVTDLSLFGSGAVTASTARPLPATVSMSEPLDVEIIVAPTHPQRIFAELAFATSLRDAPEVRASLTARAIASELIVQPSVVDFGVVRTEGPFRRAVLLLNGGAAPLRVLGAFSPDLPEVTVDAPGLPVTLGPGESFGVDLALLASRFGDYRGTLIVQTDSPRNPTAEVELQATRVEHACEISLSPNRVVFTLIPTGDTSTTTVTLRNTGVDPCVLTSAAWAPPIDPALTVLDPAWPRTILGGESATFEVAYSPLLVGESKGRLDIAIDDPAVSGISLPVAAQAFDVGSCFRVSPSVLDFGSVVEGQSVRRFIEVTNISIGRCNILASRMRAGSHSAFRADSVSGIAVDAGGSHLIGVDFVADSSTIARGAVEIETTDPLRPIFLVPVVARRAEPSVCVDPPEIHFGAVSAPVSATVRVWSCRGETISIRSINWVSPPNALSRTISRPLPADIDANREITVNVTFDPARIASERKDLLVASDDPETPIVTVPVSGGRAIVPVEAGRFLYFWNIDVNASLSDIKRVWLQGPPTIEQFDGQSSGQQCGGCHSLSPDGKYIAIVEITGRLRIIDTQTKLELPIPGIPIFSKVAWNPNPRTSPSHQFAYSSATDGHIHVASISGNDSVLAGADSPAAETFPSWGPGEIAFIVDNELFRVPETGGTRTLVVSQQNAVFLRFAAYSPDGRWIAFTEATPRQIRMVRPDGTDFKSLDAANGMDGETSWPTWSSDSKFLSYSSKRSTGRGSWDLYISTVDPLTGAVGPATPINEVNSANFEHGAEWSR
ncbi:MAG: choice-of-anchor D domain-containing protein [Deltaproteobacteria bacterium]|nr:choice-of-anchor D domain-containing protein [Deltaproteobacteria bacterium]